MPEPKESTVSVERYGPHERQFVEHYRPAATSARVRPAITLIHGGYWRNRYRLDLMHPLAEHLAADGYDTYNIEYRSIGDTDAPWPDMAADVEAVLRLIDQPQILIGHSAGGHLALWAATRATLPVAAVLALAPVSDLADAYDRELSDNATNELLESSPSDQPELYRLASPIEQLPLRVPQLVVHGKADDAVPHQMSVNYVAASRAAGDSIELLDPLQVDHFHIIDPTQEVWGPIDRWIAGFGGSLDPRA